MVLGKFVIPRSIFGLQQLRTRIVQEYVAPVFVVFNGLIL